MTVQLSTPYTDPEPHNTQRHRQTDRQTDGWQHRANKRTGHQWRYFNSRWSSSPDGRGN